MRDTRRYMSLPFNPKLKQRAQELRKAGMLHEALLWNQLKRKKFKGLDFDRQKIIGNYIVDFFCAEKGVIIEADGASHQGRKDYDAERDAFMSGLGLTVIRVAVKDILQNMEAVLVFLGNHPALAESPPRQASPATPPKEGNIAPRTAPNSPNSSNSKKTTNSTNPSNYSNYPHSPPLEGCPKGGVVSIEENNQ